ncbi:ABC transporter permease [Amycolatopsis pithecellobii]|uniref:ABC transporter permease n=1 Tax=Amycolatopsis pithecellobii TaxID=664692 RepID=A0A6N7YQN0_9PSEU|nr:ABC transporter permease [Amycolatopsis pithecellobii]MTD54292.1 ABC transporter permease [Amycolatopsis pithecellobii]
MAATKITGEPSRPRGAGARARLSALPPWAGIVVATACLVVVLSLSQSLFLTERNLQTLFTGLSPVLLMAAGATMLITLGYVDLSIGSLMALAIIVLSGLMGTGLPGIVVVVLTVAFAGAASGLTSGILVGKVGLSFFVVTIGMQAIFRSIAQLPGNGVPSDLGQSGASIVGWLSNSTAGGFPVPFLVALLVVLLGALVTARTEFGNAVRAVGGNEVAARLAGLPVARVKVIVFAISGLTVGLAAILFAGRGASADPNAGIGFELSVIAGVLLGGSSFQGGAGTFTGTFFGVTFVAIVQNGLDLIGVATFWQGVVTGAVLIAAVGLELLRKRA